MAFAQSVTAKALRLAFAQNVRAKALRLAFAQNVRPRIRIHQPFIFQFVFQRC